LVALQTSQEAADETVADEEEEESLDEDGGCHDERCFCLVMVDAASMLFEEVPMGRVAITWTRRRSVETQL
jgi:hypothetical protein